VKDQILVAMLILSFALFVTAHVTIVWGLAFRPPRWRAAVAFFVVLAAPYYAWREHMRVRMGIWAGALLLYVIATFAARF
jgi:hypothetical protein